MSSFGFAGYLERELERALSLYVNSVSASATVMLKPVAITGLTIYIVWMAYAMARGDVQNPMSKLLKDLVSVVLITSIALGFGQYQNFVIQGISAITSDLVSIVTRGNASSVGQTIDAIFKACLIPPGETECNSPEAVMFSLAIKHSNYIGIPDLWYLVSSLAIGAGQVVLVIMCLVPTVLSIVALAIFTAIGPVFVMLLIWPLTRQYFNAWLSALLGNALTLVIVSAICTIIPTMYESVLADMFAGVFEQPEPGPSLMRGSLGLLAVAVALGFTALKASQMGMQLAGGGVAMDSSGFVGQTINALTNMLGRRGQSKDAESGATSSNDSSGANSVTKGTGMPTPKGSGLARASYYSGSVAANVIKALNRRKE